MSDIDWGVIHQKLYGRPLDESASDVKADKILKDLAEDWRTAILKQSKPFLVQVAVEANKAGLPLEYLPYVFFVIVEGRKDWPTMSKTIGRPLAVGRDIMAAAGDIPPYRSALTLPPSEHEKVIDQTLQRLGLWCATKMAGAIIMSLSKLLTKYSKKIEKIHRDIPKGMGGTYLRAVLSQTLDNNPARFQDGVLLWKTLTSLL